MAETIETKIISIKDAKNGNFDIALKNFPQAQPEEGVTQIRANVIQIRNARNGNFDLVIPEDHTIEDALIQYNYDGIIDEYYNERITDIRDYAFLRTKIKKITIPNATWARRYSFDGENVSALEELYLPSLSSLGNLPFRNNPNLRVLYVRAFASTSINGCTSLTTLILGRSDVYEPGGNFSGNPFAPDGTGGYVYVPQALLSQYQASTAWQTYANVLEFRAIEGSEYEIFE